ncbi:formate-dependent phosphoribosylglycinamide formyltransferase [Alteribacillus sp. HJP-4]|uniref:formate-dependent phosphoribosylglycinamide formyltransferase n=1 Tax=Alteribacillus sp. HJP-4 TaxID=2775394 RepID=UPI0035CCE7EB
MFSAPLKPQSKKILLLGSGELGKEVMIEAQRLGLETIAVDNYDDAPAMQVAHRSHVIDMLDGNDLRKIILKEGPDFIVPEVEAIATDTLLDLEREGFNVIPTAKAAKLTMDREGIRRLAHEELQLPTARYKFADSYLELKKSAEQIGFPCVIKPVMSSSGKGQTVCQSMDDIENSWQEAMQSGRGKKTRVIVEEMIAFESEITLLTVRSISGTAFCSPIGHEQQGGDYIQSWQPHEMTETQISQAQHIAKKVTDALGGFGIFGVELFLAEEHIYFNEVSPRPHDTGMVTLITQDLSEFALHVRAILGLPVEDIQLFTPGSSHAVKALKENNSYFISGLEKAMETPGTQVRIFGKPVTKAGRRMGVTLSTAETVTEARKRSKNAAAAIKITY